MRATELAVVLLFLFIAMGVTGCAQLKNVFSPPPPQLPPAKKEAIPPSPSKPASPPPVTKTPPSPAPQAAPPPSAPAVKAPAPSPPPTKEPVPPPPVPPPAVLSPQVGQADEDRLKRESTARIQKAEEVIKQIDLKKLTKDQQDTFSTIQSFLTNAREALAGQDFLRASNLADKAQVLADQLHRSLQ